MTEDQLAEIEADLCSETPCPVGAWCERERRLVAEVRRLARYEALLAGFVLGERGIDGDAFGDAALDLYFKGQDLFEADAGTITGGDAPKEASHAE